jgi:chemotaxis protein methyltransferase CheR
VPARAGPTLEDVLTLVEARRGLPLALYRQGMIERRVTYRMRRSGSADLDAYLRRLRRDEAELDALVDSVCIKVSRFFRNPPVFERLGAVLRNLLAAGRRPRIWSAGCGRGEEPYSLAALLEAAHAPRECRVLATDVDPGALAAARLASYPVHRLREIPDEYRGCFECRGTAFGPCDRLRNRVEFSRLELTAGPAPAEGGFDLVLCRNVLIYFTRPLQARAAGCLVSALAPGGILCLGEAEWCTDLADRGLEPLDRRLHLLHRPPPGAALREEAGKAAPSSAAPVRPRGLR